MPLEPLRHESSPEGFRSVQSLPLPSRLYLKLKSPVSKRILSKAALLSNVPWIRSAGCVRGLAVVSMFFGQLPKAA